MQSDPIADYLTRIRNAVMANHKVVEIPTSKIKKEITKILFEKGYILNYKFEEASKEKGNSVGSIKIALKYHPVSKVSVIAHLDRVSKPGLRKYAQSDKLPRVMNGLGIAVISTSKGLMTDKEAKTEKIGGEVLFYIS